ncbi:Asp23/Gls24 family envelope stress response protein [Alkalibacter rhizosphaerae]|uniref:Asp23/Gls24 family envelope stress response protein n=1 Tax=Alkalibacter rhizosphaerae TaxID=2815577 RepID=A0A975AI61_9FIRM|nr:Asp23/Gls24 family envelope stress response protein [Alkalibacter rhizosphaerae]QSX08738.1 Asp23/Gls24 family envelope stress response protein [Alkalibacter rhizosphaerae]
MSAKIYNELGYINISENLIANIAGLSATECYGVVGMASKKSTDGIVQLLKGENLSKGVRIHQNDGKINIDLYVIIEFGVKISVVAENIIEKVRYNVENQTGLKIEKINVMVESVRV